LDVSYPFYRELSLESTGRQRHDATTTLLLSCGIVTLTPCGVMSLRMTQFLKMTQRVSSSQLGAAVTYQPAPVCVTWHPIYTALTCSWRYHARSDTSAHNL